MLAAAAIAFWASVSDTVDAKIREQMKAGAFPIRLKAADWKSGKNVWLLDIVAPSRELATDVLKGFNMIARAQSVNVHPMAANQVDKDILQSLASEKHSE